MHKKPAKLALCVQSVLESVKRKLFYFEDYLFEKRYGYEVSGTILKKDLSINNKNSLLHANAYQAVWCHTLRELFIEAKKTGYDFENFIDIGSGEGKACLYASTKQSFNKIIGVELSVPLVTVANRNKDKANSKNITFINADAVEFKLPNQTNFIFMFNPFDNVVLEKFISNNINHFKINNSVIAYANDIQRLSLTKFGFETIFRNQTRKISLYQLL
jgi:protein-L-isoaspartate O-methyltransferase